MNGVNCLLGVNSQEKVVYIVLKHLYSFWFIIAFLLIKSVD